MVVIILLGGGLPQAARGDDAVPTRAPSQEPRVADAILGLDADDFATRRTAFLELWQMGEAALPAVRAARNSPRVQIAQAAATLEQLLLMGVRADDRYAAALGHLLEPTPAKIVELCHHGLWDLAAQLLDSRPDIAEELYSDNQLQLLNQIAEEALRQGNATLAWPLVRVVTRPGDDDYDGSDLSVWLAQKLDLALSPGREADPEVQALRRLYAGHASAVLQMPASDDLKRKVITRYGQWQALRHPSMRDVLLGSGAGPDRAAAEAVLLEMAGEITAADAIWERLLGPAAGAGEGATDHGDAPAEPTAEPGRDLPARTADTRSEQDGRTQAAADLLMSMSPFDRPRFILALVLSGQAEGVEAFLSRTNPSAAFSFEIAGFDYVAALATVGLQADMSNFDQWLAERGSLIRLEAAQPLRGMQTFNETAHVCSLLAGLGLKSQAREILELLAEQAGNREDLWAGPGSIFSWMDRGEQRQLALQVLEAEINQLAPDTERAVWMRLFPEFPGCVEALAHTAPEAHDDEGRNIGKLQLLEKLHNWDTEYLEEVAGKGAVTDWLVRAERRILANPELTNQPGRFPTQLRELARLAAGCGDRELAYRFAQTDVRQMGLPDGLYQAQWLEAARLHAEDGFPEIAAERMRLLRSRFDEGTDHVRLVDEIKYLLLAGRYDQAVELDRSRWLRPLSVQRYYGIPSYAAVADSLQERHDYPAALEYAVPAFLLSDYSSISAYWAASDLSRIQEELQNFAASADALRGLLVEGLQPRSALVNELVSRGFHSSLRYAAERERVHRAVACVEQGDFNQAMRHIDIAARLQPQDVEVVVQCFPRLVGAGQAELAERIFARFEQALLQQIEAWPTDATAYNNLAWMYARCDRKLDEALQLAERAVAMAPDSATYLDTLAEVHYRSGRVQQALDLTWQCIRLDPRSPHYRRNVQRFSSARQ